MIVYPILGLKNIKQMLGLPVSEDDSDNDDDEDQVDPLKQLQDLCSPHRHRPSSIDNLESKTGLGKPPKK